MMRSRHNIRLFEYEGKTVLFGLIVCIAFSVFRIFRCDIMLEHLEITDKLSAIMFLKGYVFEDIGLGFFDNAVLGIIIFIPCILIAALLENRYDSEKAYYISRFGMNRYYMDNILFGALLVIGYEFIQLTVYFIYVLLFRQSFDESVRMSVFIWYLLLYYLCLFLHVLITWLVGTFIKGFMKYLIPVVLILAEICIIALCSGRRMFWCPASVITFSGTAYGHNVVFMLWMVLLCLAAGSIIAGEKYMEDIL